MRCRHKLFIAILDVAWSLEMFCLFPVIDENLCSLNSTESVRPVRSFWTHFKAECFKMSDMRFLDVDFHVATSWANVDMNRRIETSETYMFRKRCTKDNWFSAFLKASNINLVPRAREKPWERGWSNMFFSCCPCGRDKSAHTPPPSNPHPARHMPPYASSPLKTPVR